jgi:hypothetical protein
MKATRSAPWLQLLVFLLFGGGGPSAIINSGSASIVHAHSLCPDHPDRVAVVPGYPQGAPPGCWYSGYLHYELQGEQVHTHYTFMTAEDTNGDDHGAVDAQKGTGSSGSGINSTTFGYGTADDKPLIYWSSYVLLGACCASDGSSLTCPVV